MTRSECADQFARRLESSVADGTFVRLVLSRPGKAPGEIEKISVRRVDLQDGPHLSLAARTGTRETTRNLRVRGAIAWLRKQVNKDVSSALLSTTAKDWQLTVRQNGDVHWISHKPSIRTAPPRRHDRRKETVLDATANDWLHGLGVCDTTGKVSPSLADKHRQIQHYVEILSHLAADCGWRKPAGTESGTNELVLADMGCGKGYLTFGAWHLFHRVAGRRVRVLGVEVRNDLVEGANALARQLNATGLEFVRGEIGTVELPRVDALIALHACNTATDDAIQRGIGLGAKLILVAPCCHQELRPQLGQPRLLAPILRHGIMAERMAEWLTDGLRALYLEAMGYQTKLFEFVASEHTPKNLLLAAIRQPTAETKISPAREQISDIKKFFGIERHALEALFEKGAE